MNEEMKTQAQEPGVPVKAPDLITEVDGITYVVRAYFKEAPGETMKDKIKRMLQNEVLKMDLAE